MKSIRPALCWIKINLYVIVEGEHAGRSGNEAIIQLSEETVLALNLYVLYYIIRAQIL